MMSVKNAFLAMLLSAFLGLFLVSQLHEIHEAFTLLLFPWMLGTNYIAKNSHCPNCKQVIDKNKHGVRFYQVLFYGRCNHCNKS